MGWDFHGLYTADTAAARARLAADPLVRGRFARIAPADAPDHALPAGGVLVVHGFGPCADEVPWALFGPAARTPGWVDDLPPGHRPPGSLLAWMRGFGAPIALYQCRMHGGTKEAESAVLGGSRAVVAGRDRIGPLYATLLTAGSTLPPWDFGWSFPPHHTAFANPVRRPARGT